MECLIVRNKRIIERIIKPVDKMKGRENPVMTCFVDKNDITESTTDIVLYPNGTFEVKEGSSK